MKKTYDLACCKYTKFKNPKISYILQKVLLFFLSFPVKVAMKLKR